jgi:hypothetical protein
MRRKVIQEYVNYFCQKVLDLPEGYDIAAFAHHGPGIYRADILTGDCSCNGNPIPELRLCDEYRRWLKKQTEKHRINLVNLRAVIVEVEVGLDELNTHSPYGRKRASGHFFFKCRSEIKTAEKVYVGQMQGDKVWGLDWYYEDLYGCLPDIWPPIESTATSESPIREDGSGN